MDMHFAVVAAAGAALTPHIRFLFISPQICSTLPSDLASRRRPFRRYKELKTRGTPTEWAAKAAGSCYGPWRMSRSPAVLQALPDATFTSLGLPSLRARATA